MDSLPTKSAREAALIGAVLQFGVYDEIPPHLEASDFTDQHLGACWNVIKARATAGKPIDAASVVADLGPAAADALQEAAMSAATGAHAVHHASGIIADAAFRSLLRAVTNPEASDLESLCADLNGAMSIALERVHAADGEDVFGSPDSMMDAAVKIVDKAMRGELVGYKTGLSKLDFFTNGIFAGQTWIIGAKPSSGKSTLMMQFAEAVAVAGGQAAFVSVEMPTDQIALRALAGQTGHTTTKLLGGSLTADDWGDVMRGAAKYTNTFGENLAVTHRLGNDIDTILHALKRRKRTVGLDVVFIDYLQRLYAQGRVGKSANRNTEIEVITNALADFGRDTGTGVVIASQFKRSQNTRPSMDSLRDSGAIEAAADVIGLLHREKDDDDEYTGKTELIIDKNRQGPTGVIDIHLDPSRMRFFPVVDDFGRAV